MNLVGSYRGLGEQEYRATSALELGRGIRSGELSPVQLTEIALELAAQDDRSINAYSGLRTDAALAEASEREAEARAGRFRSVLHGVPIASKDNMSLVGEPMRKGSRTTSEEPARVPSPMVARLVEAGTVVIGRTTTPEFGWKGTGISPLTGITRNPWDPSRNSGGSSAGSGATVGAGAVPLATGTDAGGSVRIPAAFCGTVGFKPTLSAIPVWPGTVNESLSHAGVLARSVADARAMFELTRGPDARDPQSFFVPRQPLPLARRPLIGVARAPWGIPPSEDVGHRLGPAFDAIVASGVGEVIELELDIPVPREVFEALWVTGRGFGFAELVRTQADVMDPGLARLTGLAEEYSLPDFLAALTARRAFNARIFEVLEAFDVVVMPTMPLTAFAADAEVPPGGESDAPLPWITWTPYTYPFNISGQPAITLPADLAADRLPVGVQVVGGWGRDDLVLDIATRLEAVLAPTVQRRTAR